MAGMSGGSMLRARRKDVNVKPNRKLDRKSSRGMLYENEELRLRTININAEVERGQSDIKKLKRENEQLRREISALRYEYDRLDSLLRDARHSDHDSDESGACCSACNSDCEEPACRQNNTNEGRALPAVPEEDGRKDSDADLQSKSTTETECGCSDCRKRNRQKTAKHADATEKARARDAAKFPKTSIDVLINDNAIPPALAQTSLALAQTSDFAPQTQTLAQNYPSNYFVSSNPVPGFVSSNVLVNDLVVPFSTNGNNPFVFNNSNNFATGNADGQRRFHTGGNVEDLLSDMESVNSFRNDYVKNSVFMCNTRKIIQQKMVQNIMRENVVKAKCPCSCGEKNKNLVNAETPAVIVEMIDPNGQTSYVTEKNIELHYDYPRAMAIPKKSPSPKPVINESLESIATNNFETNIESEIVQTTTEVNSTILMFERKKRLPKQRRFDFFSRSHSAPEGDSPEPIYATVKKLPKKLKKLNITNLENEVTYQLPSAQNTEIYNPNTSEYLRPNVVINNVTADLSDLSEHKEELQTIDENTQDNVIETISTEPATSIETNGLKEENKESPKLKKRRRFSLHFKKRVPKVSINEAKKAVTITETSTEKDENSNLENRTSKETDRLIITNGHPPPVQAEIKTVNHNTACKHRKKSVTGHESINMSRRPSNFSCRERKIHVKGDRRSHSLDKAHEPFIKSHSYHPVKHYFKQDSYQEMTTSHSEQERTNSLTSSLTSACSVETHQKSRGPATPVHGDSIPWCGCWGNSCL